MTMNGDRPERTELAGAAWPVPVERPSIPLPLLRLSSPVPELGEHQERGHQAVPQGPAPAAESSAAAEGSGSKAPRVRRVHQPPTPSVAVPAPSVQPTDLCRWGERAEAIDSRLAQLCRRTYR